MVVASGKVVDWPMIEVVVPTFVVIGVNVVIKDVAVPIFGAVVPMFVAIEYFIVT